MTVAEIAARHLGRRAAATPTAFALEHLPSFEVDVVRRWPSVEKAKTLLGWEAQIAVERRDRADRRLAARHAASPADATAAGGPGCRYAVAARPSPSFRGRRR